MNAHLKLHIFGASGSGVTTLGNVLSQQLAIPYFDSDDYFWEQTDPPYTNRRIPAQRNALVLNDLAEQPHWILGGSVIHWGSQLFLDFSLVIFLYLPHEVRMERLKKREYERYGDSIYSNPHRAKQYEEFLAWAADYDLQTGVANRTLKAQQQWLETLQCPVLKIEGDLTVKDRMEQTLAAIRHL